MGAANLNQTRTRFRGSEAERIVITPTRFRGVSKLPVFGSIANPIPERASI
jgi:hypothetical protein